jgi:hypothetical protein
MPQGPRPALDLANIASTDFPLFLTGTELIGALERITKNFFTDNERQAAGVAGVKVQGLAHETVSTDAMEQLDAMVGNNHESKNNESQNDGGGAKRRPRLRRHIIRKEIDFSAFTDKLKKSGTGQSEAAAIYRDIYSYIKGSAKALSSDNGALSLDEYLGMDRKSSASSSKKRRDWYEIFLEFKKKKKHLISWTLFTICSKNLTRVSLKRLALSNSMLWMLMSAKTLPKHISCYSVA